MKMWKESYWKNTLHTVYDGACRYCASATSYNNPRPFHCFLCGEHLAGSRTVCLMDIRGPIIWCQRCQMEDGMEPVMRGTSAAIRWRVVCEVQVQKRAALAVAWGREPIDNLEARNASGA